jgi:acyl-CoA dehydrogenase
MSTTNPANETAEMSAIVLEQAERLFRGEITKERLEAADGGAWPAELWAAVEENGLTLAMVPEAAGGVGLPAADALKLLRLSGYHTLPLPLAETMIGAALWAEASGEAVAGPLTIGPTAPAETLLISKSGADWTLAGTLTRIPWAAQSAHALLHARDAAGAGYLVLLPRGTGRIEPRANIGKEPRDTLVLDGVTVAAAAVRPAPAACREGMLAAGALLRTQQMVGAMERALDYALAYVMERKQFGRELAKFQAIQQQLAEAAGLFAISAAAADGAREAWGRPGFEMSVALAKARVGEAVNRLTDVCHQVHGAMGYTQELPLHFATRRLWAWREEFGSETYWQRRIGEWACANGGEALWRALAENRFE